MKPGKRNRIQVLCQQTDVNWRHEYEQKDRFEGGACATLCDLFLYTQGKDALIEELFKNLNNMGAKKVQNIKAHQARTARSIELEETKPNSSADESLAISVSRKLSTNYQQSRENLFAASPPNELQKNAKKSSKTKTIITDDVRRLKFNELTADLLATSLESLPTIASEKTLKTDYFEPSPLSPKKISFLNSSNISSSSSDNNNNNNNNNNSSSTTLSNDTSGTNVVSTNNAYANLAEWIINKIDNSMEEPVGFKFQLADRYREDKTQKEMGLQGHCIAGFKVNGKIYIFDPNAGVFVMGNLSSITTNVGIDNRKVWLEKHLATYKVNYPVPYIYLQHYPIQPDVPTPHRKSKNR